MKTFHNSRLICVKTWRFAVIVVAFLSLLENSHARYPDWWAQLQLLKTDGNGTRLPADDYAVANAGQLKNIASGAFVELREHLQGGIGDTISPTGTGTLLTNLVNGWRTSNNADDYAAINLGQLKNVAKLFYDRLIEVGYCTNYPWSNGTADDFAVANLGQLKRIFSFDVRYSSWGTSVPDWWIVKEWGSLHYEDPLSEDPAGSGNTIGYDYLNGRDPLDYYNDAPVNFATSQQTTMIAQPGTDLSQYFEVTVLKQNGQPWVGAPVTFSITHGNAFISTSPDFYSGLWQSTSLDVTTNQQGVAFVYLWTSNPGAIALSATTGKPGRLAPVTFGIDVGAPVTIASGGAHNLMMKQDGSVWAWGSNSSGQLGDGNGQQFVSAPVRVTGFPVPVVAVAAGISHSLALLNDGSLYAWGDNYFGQLGDGTRTEHVSPENISALSGIVAIAAGGQQSLALKNDGSVWAWGNSSTTPTLVSGLSGIVSIACGSSYDIALDENGNLWAWGDDSRGELGDGTNNNAATPIPISLPAGMLDWQGRSKIAAIFGGDWYAMALTTDGQVWAWGANDSGQLGNTSGVDSNVPIIISGLGNIKTLAAGYSHTLAYDGGGNLWTWGNNGLGQLGNGSTNGGGTLSEITPPEYSTTSIVGMTSGGAWSVVVLSNGDVWGWGDNESEELGTRDRLISTFPVEVPFPGGPNTLFSAGYAHSLAVQSDGTVWAWGDNSCGELGDGTTTSRNNAVQVKNLTNVIAVAAGYYHSLALESNGTVWAWGANWDGQLGNGTTAQSTTPVQVQGINFSVVAIAAGNGFSIAMSSTGSVCGWGDDSSSQTGLPLYSTSTNNLIPRGIPAYGDSYGGFNIAAGDGFGLILVDDGSVWSWGSNACGQLGNGTTANSLSMVQVQVPGFVTQIAAGAGFGLAVTSDGNVWAWGANGYGQLGNNTTVNSSTPVQVLNISNPLAIVAGDGYAAALLPNGTVYTWGLNVNGQLGNNQAAGSTPYSPIPVQVLALSGNGSTSNLGNIIKLAAGGLHVLALNANAQMLAWGGDSSGQLGDGDNSDEYAAITSRAFVSETIPPTILSSPLGGNVSAGDYHTVAVKGDGTVWAWGYNYAGQVGVAPSTEQMVYPVQVLGLNNISAVAAGGSHTLALKSDGTVWAWGENGNGQLGNGTNNSTYIPQQIDGLSQVVAIAAGEVHSVAVKSDGTVWAWGNNGSGQLGTGNTNQSLVPVLVGGTNPNSNPLLNIHIVSVAAGGDQTLALTAGGAIWAWGGNGEGEVGDGTNSNRNLPVAVSVPSGNSIVQVAAGYQHSLALDSAGNVWAWGWDAYGQLGDGGSTRRNAPYQVAISSAARPVRLAGGHMHSLALMSDGSILGWGSSNSGQLGNQVVGASPTAVSISGLNGMVGVTAGEMDSVCLKSDGTVWTLGDNAYGELGIGTVAGINSPQAIFGLNLLGYAPVKLSVPNGTIVANSGGNVLFDVEIPDNSGNVSSVQYYNGTTLLGTTIQAPYEFTWQNVPAGLYSITAKAVTNQGVGPASAPVTVKVMRAQYDSLSAGGSYSVVLRNDGTVWSWGANASGQLGDATVVERHGPVVARGLQNVIAIAAGGSHTLALLDDGTVWAWGDNASGQLGLGNTDTTNREVPVQITSLSGIVAIAAGQNHSLALGNDGTVYAWGSNANGQLATGSIGGNLGLPNAVGQLSGVVAIAAGDNHSLALTTGGTIIAWGAGANGQLGNGASFDSGSLVNVSGASGVTAIAAGGNQSMALRNNGTVSVIVWGANANQPGDSNTPVTIPGLSGSVEIAAGESHLLALQSNGTVMSWGANGNGQLGNGGNGSINTPYVIPNMTGIVALAGGGNDSLAVRNDGTVWVWGANANGELADGTIVDSKSPEQVGELNGTIATAEGSTHTVALHSDGTVWAWGGNASGQLGNNSTLDSSSPVQATGIFGAVAVAAGNTFSLALGADGTVWAWGDNTYGEVGDGTNTGRLSPVPVPLVKGIVAISAGANFALALKSDGTVWAWGDNGNSELGNTSAGSTCAIPVQVAALPSLAAGASLSTTHVVEISAGGSHGLALDSNGAVWSWGQNNDGQLGDNSMSNLAVPAQIIAGGVVAIAGGGSHSLALKSDGTLLAWGDNSRGQLGNSSVSTISAIPVAVLAQGGSSLGGVILVGAGQYHSMAVQNNGTVWVWGDNSNGQLGNGPGTDSFSPVQVSGYSGGATAVSTGSQASHTLLLNNLGNVWGWGLNASGELGNGSSTPSGPVLALGIGIIPTSSGPVITLTEPNGATLLR